MLSAKFSLGRRSMLKAAGGVIGIILAGCGGGSGGGTSNAQSNTQEDSLDTLPQINRHPSSQAVNLGQSAVFEVSASGTQPLMYQWQRDGVDIPGAVGEMYDTGSLDIQDDGAVYTVLISNNAGSVQSDEAIINIFTQGLTVDSTSVTVDALSITL